MQPIKGLEVVFSNPEPKREPQYPNVWLLLSNSRSLKVFVVQDAARRPRVVGREAA